MNKDKKVLCSISISDVQLAHLVNVIEDPFVQRQKVLQLGLTQAVLGRRQVTQRPRHQHITVLRLDTVEQPVDALVYGVGERRHLRRKVRPPAADDVEHELDEQRQVALGDGGLDDVPLRWRHLTVGLGEPRVKDDAAQILAQWRHLAVVVRLGDHLA